MAGIHYDSGWLLGSYVIVSVDMFSDEGFGNIQSDAAKFLKAFCNEFSRISSDTTSNSSFGIQMLTLCVELWMFDVIGLSDNRKLCFSSSSLS